jgi:hypothetical protein
MAGRLRRSVRWGIVSGEFMRRGMSDSSSEEEEKEDERSIWEVAGCGVVVDVDVVESVDDDGEAIGDIEDEDGRSSEEEDMLSLEVCCGAGRLVGGDDESIALVDLVRLIVVSGIVDLTSPNGWIGTVYEYVAKLL